MGEHATVQKAGILIIATCLLIAGLYDIVVVLYRPEYATISEIVLTLSKSYPIVPFLLGILVGHLLWPQYSGSWPF